MKLDKETWRQGDKESDASNLLVSLSPHLLVFRLPTAIGIRTLKIAPNLNQPAAMLAGDFGNHILRLGIGHAANDRHARLDDARLFAGNRGRACCRAGACGRS